MMRKFLTLGLSQGESDDPALQCLNGHARRGLRVGLVGVMLIAVLLPKSLWCGQRVILRQHVENFLAEWTPECPGEIRFLHFHDFGGDGVLEAVLIAQTCAMPTGGPDVHKVLQLDEEGRVREVLSENEMHPHVEPDRSRARVVGIPLALVGNRNSRFELEGDRLCVVFRDGSSRPHPRTDCYTFDDDHFDLNEIRYGQVYETSFDCTRALTDREITVCGDAELAKLDLELSEIYHSIRIRLKKPQRSALIAEQRAWLQELDRWHAYKWCCDELRTRYSDRIFDLKNWGTP